MIRTANHALTSCERVVMDQFLLHPVDDMLVQLSGNVEAGRPRSGFLAFASNRVHQVECIDSELSTCTSKLVQ